VAVAARLAGIAAVDQAVTSISDDEAFLRDAQAGRNIGYQGKICVHPRQVPLAHRVFTPTEDEIRHALAVLEAAGNGVAVVDGQMVDQVHVRLAETTLARRDQA
jgi:citrate lyase subunit beta/citryl-CoA lyase